MFFLNQGGRLALRLDVLRAFCVFQPTLFKAFFVSYIQERFYMLVVELFYKPNDLLNSFTSERLITSLGLLMRKMSS